MWYITFHAGATWSGRTEGQHHVVQSVPSRNRHGDEDVRRLCRFVHFHYICNADDGWTVRRDREIYDRSYDGTDLGSHPDLRAGRRRIPLHRPRVDGGEKGSGPPTVTHIIQTGGRNGPTPPTGQSSPGVPSDSGITRRLFFIFTNHIFSDIPLTSALALEARRTRARNNKGGKIVLGSSAHGVGHDEIEELVVGEDAFDGSFPSSDFTLYLFGVGKSITCGSHPLMHRTGVNIFFPDCGEKVMLEVTLPKPEKVAMTAEVLGVGFTLLKDFDCYSFLRDGERITLRIRKSYGKTLDMHARGPISRAPWHCRSMMVNIRVALRDYLEQRES